MHYEMEMTEEKAFKKDVKSMSYEELMATIRYLDEERVRLSQAIQHNSDIENHKQENISKRAA
jgi:hypothetical protein